MSAELDKRDRKWLIANSPRQLNELEQVLLETTFDEQTEYDINLIEKEQRQTSFLKRVAIYKLITFFPDYILTLILFPKKYRETKRKTLDLYTKFLFKKINLERMKKELKLLLSDGIIN